MNSKYDILIKPIDGESYTITLETSDLEWSIEQYGRNRKPFSFEIVKAWQ